MDSDSPQPQPAGGGSFVDSLRTALGMFDDPSVGCVAATLVRGRYIADLIARSGECPRERIAVYLDREAAAAIEAQRHRLVVLDASVDPEERRRLTDLAKASEPRCKVFDIKGWSVEPPL